MLFRVVIGALVLPSLMHAAKIDDTAGFGGMANTQNEIAESNYSHDQLDYALGEKYAPPPEQRPTNWLQTAREALSGPAGEFAVHFAKEMISRSTGNSQVNPDHGPTKPRNSNFRIFSVRRF